jgi:SagB-type dehydrogenase family enzyme
MMEMERRGFFGKTAAWAAGIAVALRTAKSWAKLPSDSGEARAAAADTIALPGFDKNVAFTLDQALAARKTSRSYDPAQALTPAELSRLTWAMTGVNREDGKRTTPSAMAKYPVDVYVALPEGVYAYDPAKHELKKVSAENLREQTPIQGDFKKAGALMLYVINKSRLEGEDNPWSDLEIGCMVQNVYLEAASLGLGSCVFALVKKEAVTKALGLKSNQLFRIAQAVGRIK